MTTRQNTLGPRIKVTDPGDRAVGGARMWNQEQQQGDRVKYEIVEQIVAMCASMVY